MTAAPQNESLARWLRCPLCRDDLTAIEGLVLGCANGHRFDGNKRGYVSMLGTSKFTGDTAEILESRSTFLSLGYYSPIAEAVVAAVPEAAGAIIDSGCGTGYYLGAVIDSRPGIRSLALDVSTAAVARSIAQTGSDGLVADVWASLPLRDGVTEVVLCVFAPRNGPEFARVLSPGGTLVVVTPTESHLAELREAGVLIGIQDDKLSHLDAALPGFSLQSRESLEYRVQLTTDEQRLLAGMGPSGHHELAEAVADTETDTETVTVSVTISQYTRGVN